MTEEQNENEEQTVLHKKSLEQLCTEAVDELIKLEKVRPEERMITIQALLRANQGYLGGGEEETSPDEEE